MVGILILVDTQTDEFQYMELAAKLSNEQIFQWQSLRFKDQ